MPIDPRPLLILQRARDDFRRRRRAFVDQHDDRHARQDLARARVVALRVAGAPSARRDDFALIEERVRNADRLIEQAARIVAQVEDDAAQAAADLGLRLIDGLLEPVFGLLVERRDADVGDVAFSAGSARFRRE